ncbi:cytidylyltransferase domain-containing protein [Demequina sp.]|uniref:cytidylyltransferase domain-containing protein n=1 Tax=Demequina sp. TaxID=2050685 RepID=UPI003A870388
MSARSLRIAAVIPARGGSKGVPGKNVARVGGVPLVGRAAQAALSVPAITDVCVSTDDAGIAQVARQYGAAVIDRPAQIAGDTATSESALVHALDVLEADGGPVDVLVFLQATSPFIPADCLADAVARVASGDEDVVFSAFETYAFLWREGEAGAEGVNHDSSFRPRRQDREPHFQETGAFYVMRAEGFRAAGHRFFGRVGIAPVPESSAIEIDTAAELEMSRGLAALLASPGPIDADALVTDFDGVHTDDLVTVNQDGVESVTVSRSDGMGVGLLRAAGVPILILSKEKNPVVAARAAKLQVDVLHGIDDKLPELERWCAAQGVDLTRVAYVGNDINDVACMRAVGWPVAVADARAEALAEARVVLTRPGGRGAVREAAERVLAARG